jgi:hypothetical protein
MARKTYGEVIVEEKNKMKMVDGVFIIESKLPARMSYKSAMIYYSNKLDEYWLSQIDIKPNSKITKEKFLQVLKGRNLNDLFELIKE